MDTLSGLRAYDFALTALKQTAEREGQVLKKLTEDKAAGPSQKAVPVRRAPVASASALGQIVDIRV